MSQRFSRRRHGATPGGVSTFPWVFGGDVLLHSSLIYLSGSGTFNLFGRLSWGSLASVFQTAIVPDEPIRAKGAGWRNFSPTLHFRHHPLNPLVDLQLRTSSLGLSAKAGIGTSAASGWSMELGRLMAGSTSSCSSSELSDSKSESG